MKDRVIVALERQYGSGGREIGKKLAQTLDIPFYDQELLALAAKKSGMSEEYFQNVDETSTNSFLYSLMSGAYMAGNPMDPTNAMPVNDKLFLLESNLIREIAQKGSCVIIGRCADYILQEDPDMISVFVHADLEDRKRRAIEEYGEDAERIEEILKRQDKRRVSYYNFYTTQKWGQARNYDLCFNSGIGMEQSVALIQYWIEMKQRKGQR